MHSDAEAKALFFFLFPSHFLLIFSGGSSHCQLPCLAPRLLWSPFPEGAGSPSCLQLSVSPSFPSSSHGLADARCHSLPPSPPCSPVRQLSWATGPRAGLEQEGREDSSARRPVTHSQLSARGGSCGFISALFLCLLCCCAAIPSAERSDSRAGAPGPSPHGFPSAATETVCGNEE